jgi:hypothetical protein
MSVTDWIVALVVAWPALALLVGMYVGRVIAISNGDLARQTAGQTTSSMRAVATSKTKPRTLSR